MEEILNPTQNVESYCQAEEVSEVASFSGKITSLVDKAAHARVQESDIPSMQQKEEDRRSNTIAFTIFTSNIDNTSSHLIHPLGFKFILHDKFLSFDKYLLEI